MVWRTLAPGNAEVTLTVDGFSEVVSVAVTDPFPPQTYTAWKSVHFSAEELADPEISGDTADHDGDELSTFFEYILGDDPHEPATFVPLQLGFLEEAGGKKPILVARLSSTITGYTVAVQVSPDLEAWTEVYRLDGAPELEDPAVVDYIDAGAFYEIWLEMASEGAVDSPFFRVVVSPGS